MPKLRMLLFTFLLMAFGPNHVDAAAAHHDEDSPEAAAAELHAEAPAHGEGGDAKNNVLATSVEEKAAGPVVALDEKSGKSRRQGELLEAGAETLRLVDRANNKYELSPHGVAEFGEDGSFRLLRGAALLESQNGTSLRTSSARVDFKGRLALSYDHKEQSTSAFVIDGEARLVNPHGDDRSLRLERFRGASMVVGQVMPQLVRQLDVGGVRAWLEGYGFAGDRVQEALRGVPDVLAESPAPEPAHLKSAKLEDYFSAIDTADEQNQPDYYQRKFQDPDVAIAESKSKQKTGKPVSPEEAALIALPSTKIDLGFDLQPEVLTPEQKAAETVRIVHGQTAPKRGLASVKPGARKPAAAKASGDPEVNAVLERLRSIPAKEPVLSSLPEGPKGRAPSSVRAGAVPDPVYDYSQNF